MRLHGAVVLAAFALGACTTEKIVYVTRPPFNPPPDQSSGFLGYFTVSDKQTTCGNCHVEKQATWKFTKHASAYEDLVRVVPAAPAACKNCHTVSQLGNAVPDDSPAGFAKVADNAYHDVQCESCHGPGFDHVQSPSLSNIPLARVNVSPDTVAAVTSPTCAACHNRQGGPAPSFVEEWSQSGHARVVPELVAEGIPSCSYNCHEGRGVLRAWNVLTNYVEKNDPITPATAFAQTCAVCHDPHSSANDGQLRWPIDDPNPDNNLCMKCHLRAGRDVPGTGTTSAPRGPHAAQGGVLLGTAGWWPQLRDTIRATHGNPAANARLCAGCHVNEITVQGGGGLPVNFKSVGHLFKADPCLDASGTPIAGDCPRPGDPNYVSGSRAFIGCQKAGCHNSAVQAEDAFKANRAVIAILADALWKDVDGDLEMLTYNTTTKRWASFDAGDTGLLTRIADTDAVNAFNYGDGVVSAAEGSHFNVRMIGEKRYDQGDGSFGTHNPLLTVTLLTNSITALQAQYPYLSVAPAVQTALSDAMRHVAQARAAQVSSR